MGKLAEIRSVCVYCGSSLGHDPRHRATAAQFGETLAAAKIELVYGGGNIGLMGVLADAAIGGGGRVTGIIPEDLKRAELAHEGLDDLVTVSSMHERKRQMFERADAFVALPGGPGTLDETIEIITWRQLHLHGKPLVILNEGDYWRPLLDLFDHTIAGGFARESFRQLFLVVDRVEDVLPALATYRAPEIPDRPERV
jgi:uncharacterized protein (TIGR00730 family)